MSLTPEELSALSQSFKDAMTDTSQTLSNLDVGIRLLIKDNQNASLEAKKFASGVGTAAKNLDALTEAEKAQIKAAEILVEKQRLLDSATQNAKASLGSFATGLLDTNVKLTNYSDAVGKAGDAAWDLGKSFGPLGMVIGGVVKGFTALAQASLKQTQSLLDAKDALNKMGGAGSYTTESIYKMARASDLNSETISRLIKPMQSMGSSVMVLGQGAADSQKKFAELTKVTSEQRMQFMRLGISQEDMMQGQADYVALQAMSGVSIKNQFEDTKKLRQASLDYQTNLLDLAALTGADTKELKEKQQAALKDRQLMIDNMMMQHKAQRLREQADKETDSARKAQLLKQADAIENEVAARQEGIRTLAGLKAPEALIKGVKEIITTGSISGKDAQVLARLGMEKEVEEFQKTIKEGGDAKVAAAKLDDAYKKKFGDNLDRMGDALKVGTTELNDMYGANVDSLQQITEQQDNLEQATKDQVKKRKEAEKPGADPAADARAKAQEATIKTTGAMDDLVHAANPLVGKFDLLKGTTIALTAAAAAAALALGGLSAGKLLGGGGGGGGGLLGKLGGEAGSAGGIGSKALSAGKGLLKGGALAIGGAALEYGGDKLKESGHEKLGGAASVLGKSASYAGTGAMIGSVIPGVGTAVGGALGAALGAGMGLYENWGNMFGSKGDANASLDSSSKASGSSDSSQPSGGRGANAGKFAGGGKVGGSMSDKDVKDMIVRHEGKRNAPYKDSLGLWTIGVGHLIGDGRTLPKEWNRQFSDSEIMGLFDKDYDKHKNLAQSNVPGFNKFDTMGQGAFIDLTFNMGGGWPQKFKNTSKSLAMGDTEGAAAGLEGSKWFTQVGRRGPEVTNMIRNSKVSARDGGLSMGPESGYPATLHGNEMIVPLDPNSILADLGKKSKQQVETSVASGSITKSSSNDGFRELLNINQAMMEMMSTKLDNVINKLADSHDTQNKILRYSQA